MKQYAALTKWVLICINIASVLVLGGCLILGGAVFKLAGNDWDSLVKGLKYSESSVLQNSLEGQAVFLERYIKESRYFETNGVYNPERMVDIIDYRNTMQNQEENSVKKIGAKLQYRLGELLGVYTTVEGIPFKYIQETMSNGVPLDLQTLQLNLGISAGDIEQQIEKIDQIIKPKGYLGLKDYVTTENQDLTECYTTLLYVIGRIQTDIDDYQTSKVIYSSKNTNLQYIITDRTTNTKYTNTAGFKFSVKESEIVKVERGDFKMEITLDETYPIHDNFYKKAVKFDKYTPYFSVIVWSTVIGLIGVVITYILLGVMVIGNQTIQKLEWIDKFRIEFMLVLWIGIGGSAAYFAHYNAQLFCKEFDLIRLGFAEVCSCIFALIAVSAFLSLSRRIRAKNLVANSLFLSVRDILIETFGHTKISIKLITFFLGYILISLICSWWLEYGLVILVIFNIVVGILILKDGMIRQRIHDGIHCIAKGDFNYKINEAGMLGSNLELAKSVNCMGDGLLEAVQDSMKSERLKADLITNVSHDIKTPLTSIINYVDLLKREKIENEKVQNYIKILDDKSQRLKQLTEDLVEASKISSGNISLELEDLDFRELLQQTIGEFEEKFQGRRLEMVIKCPEVPVIIQADGRRVWRIVENLFNNVIKYAMQGTRVYIDLVIIEHKMFFSIKNISEYPLNIESEDLTERFIRGDVSRSTEGSGLGLSIAQNLTILQKGDFDIYLDGDLFKVTVRFNVSKE